MADLRIIVTEKRSDARTVVDISGPALEVVQAFLVCCKGYWPEASSTELSAAERQRQH